MPPDRSSRKPYISPLGRERRQCRYAVNHADRRIASSGARYLTTDMVVRIGYDMSPIVVVRHVHGVGMSFPPRGGHWSSYE